MTNTDIAELRGEIFGLKIMLVNCIGFIAAITDDPNAHLDAIQNESIEGIAMATNDKVKDAYLQTFRAAAAGLVLQVVEGAKVASVQVSKPHWLQYANPAGILALMR
jgi:hypothetical protein